MPKLTGGQPLSGITCAASVCTWHCWLLLCALFPSASLLACTVCSADVCLQNFCLSAVRSHCHKTGDTYIPCKASRDLLRDTAMQNNDEYNYLSSSLAPVCIQLDTTGKSGVTSTLKKPLCHRLESAPATLPMLRSNVNTGFFWSSLFMVSLAWAFGIYTRLSATKRAEPEICLGSKLLVECWHGCIARALRVSPGHIRRDGLSIEAQCSV